MILAQILLAMGFGILAAMTALAGGFGWGAAIACYIVGGAANLLLLLVPAPTATPGRG